MIFGDFVQIKQNICKRKKVICHKIARSIVMKYYNNTELICSNKNPPHSLYQLPTQAQSSFTVLVLVSLNLFL